MTKLKDQRDAIKRTITKGSVMKVRKNPELLEEQYSALAKKKKKLYLSFYLYDKIQDFLHTIVFTIQFSVSVVYDNCGVMFVNIRYFTEIMITVIVITMSVEHLKLKKTHLHTTHPIYT